LLSDFLSLLRLRQADDSVRWLNRNLAIGCPREEADWLAMRDRGVRGVVDLSEEPRDLGPMVRQQGLRYLRLPVANGALPPPEELHIVTSWALQRISDEGPVLVHESDDRGNAGLIACAVLVKRGSSLYRAHSQLKHKSRTPLSEAQLDLLENFAREVSQTLARR
jgi:hypothetical protein